MKYAILIADGAADEPQETLAGKTPLEAARTPHIDSIAIDGRQGTVAATPESFEPGTDVACLSLLGFDPDRFQPGRAALEAIGMGLEMRNTDWALCLSLITADENGNLLHHAAGNISTPEGKHLLEELQLHIDALEGGEEIELLPGVGHRHLLIDRSQRDYDQMTSFPPHNIPDQALTKHMPRGGRSANLIQQIIEDSQEIFARSEINATRLEMGELPATHAWLWAPGNSQTPEPVPTFHQLFGLHGAIVSATRLLAGIAKMIGFKRLDTPGLSRDVESNHQTMGRIATAALDEHDIVVVHAQAPDEASHIGDITGKVAALESIDMYVFGPLIEKLKKHKKGWRILVAPDHYTLCESRCHHAQPVPFAMCGTGVKSLRHLPFTEANSDSSDLHIHQGHTLMEYFLRSGL